MPVLQEVMNKRALTPEQKRTLIDRLYQLWLHNPKLRFGQLIRNVYLTDFYYVEDEDFIHTLEQFYKGVEHERHL